jgi:beta-glucosidase-like glycosyl hydrolase
MRYEGAVVTDALEASAVRRRSSVTGAAERSLTAGCDLLLLTRPSSRRSVVRHLAERAAASRAVGFRVRDAVARVLALKPALGLHLPQPRRYDSQPTPSLLPVQVVRIIAADVDRPFHVARPVPRAGPTVDVRAGPETRIIALAIVTRRR